MALSKKDKEFWEEKLSLKMAGYLLLYTALLGGISVPTALYIQDASSGHPQNWSFDVVMKDAEVGVMFGVIIAILMYLAFKLLLQIGWLPSRR